MFTQVTSSSTVTWLSRLQSPAQGCAAAGHGSNGKAAHAPTTGRVSRYTLDPDHLLPQTEDSVLRRCAPLFYLMTAGPSSSAIPVRLQRHSFYRADEAGDPGRPVGIATPRLFTPKCSP